VQPTPGFAQTHDTLRFIFGADAVHDSNVFRLPDSVDPQSIGRPGRSDTTRSGYVGARLDLPYSLQRFQLDVTETAYRHEKFTQLDFDASSYRGAWLWRLTPKFSGVLSADHNEAAVPFADFLGTQRNVRTTENRIFSLDGLLYGGNHVLLGIASMRQVSSAPVAAEADFESDRAEIGWKYVALSGSSFGFTQRFVEGEYLNRSVLPGSISDNGFSERQSEYTTSLVLTRRSTLGGRLTWIDRRHPNLPQRNYTGLAGNASFSWSPAAKLQFGFIAQRDITAAIDPLARFTRRDTLSVAPVWQATGRIALRGRLGRVHTDYRNSSPAAPSRKDDTDVSELGLDWTPIRSLTLGASVQQEERSSNLPGFDYRATISRFSASFIF
jgi:exopolysaccharide biosynthesis operon protein EpsL